jgi:hypothetical protein
MWIPTYHAFPSRAAFLAACDAAGWTRGPDGRPMPPEGAAVQEIGPIMAPPSVGADGSPVPGDVLDARYHVNAAWHGIEPPASFAACAVAPGTPSRAFALPAPPPPVEASVPAVIPAWKGKAALREAGLLDAVEAAVAVAGGRVQDAWAGASDWNRDSDFLLSLATDLGLTMQQVDDMFRVAAAIRS